MQTLDRRNATTITIVLAVLFGCSGIFTCIGALLGVGSQTGVIEPFGLSGWLVTLQSICMGLAFIALPVVFYFLLLAGRSDNGNSSSVPSVMEKADTGSGRGAAAPSPSRPAGMPDATFIEEPDDPSMKATLVASGFDDDDDSDDE